MSDDRPRPSWPSKLDVFLWWLVNVSSGFFLSAAHNVLYFASDIHTPVIHFLHYASTALFLYIVHFTRVCPKATGLPLRKLSTPIILKFVETLLSSVVHSQNRTGGLYVIRIFDFLTTFGILYGGKKFSILLPERPPNCHLITLALTASLSWLEFGQMEYTLFSLLCAPCLAITRAASILSICKATQRLRAASIDVAILQYCTLNAAALFLPALVSFATRNVEVTASWESIDFVLMYISPVFMAAYVYSELWLLLHAGPKMSQIAEHTKFTLASVGQWIIQNMAHPNVFAFIGKLLFAAAGARLVASEGL